MLKRSVLAITTIAALSVAAPAFAQPTLMASNDIHGYSESSMISRLETNGIQVTGVESWGRLVRADVILNDGSHAVQLYDPYTLKLVTL